MKWFEYLTKAKYHYNLANEAMTKAVRALMHENGFSKAAVDLFDADLTSGGSETVITFNGDGVMADLDIAIASGMAKEEIIHRLTRTRDLTKATLNLLNKEL